ncbi:hypothetical protein MMC30_003940 [Trapelia coarctata]|nr:hypothetical protein [Trapelia coarctata]
MSPRHGASSILSPSLSGPQTASTESTHTVRGIGMPNTPGLPQVATPSYPFPSMGMDTGTPIGTPALHKPFTALSPTVTPSPMKQTKGQTSKDFMESGHLTPSSMRAFLPSHQAGIHDLVQNPGPSLFDAMLRIQSEPGMPGFWAQITQVLRESYGAERVILAVPSDSTDIENVPWAQMATFNVGEEDTSTRLTTEAKSAEGKSEPREREEVGGEYTGEGSGSPSIARNIVSSAAYPALPSRPRLESRHSYAGYPLNSINSEPANSSQTTLRRPTASRAGSHLSLRGGRPVQEYTLRNTELSTETLRRHDADESSRGAMSEITMASSGPQPGTVLSSFQPLESELEPLLTSAGVVRVLDRGKTVILTRDFSDQNQSLEQRIDQRKQRSATGARNWPTAPTSAVFGGDQSNVKSSKSSKRPRSYTSGSSQSSTALRGLEDDVSRATYDDYEQISASPWSQSPAPSPAAQADPDINPFFVHGSIDEESFAEQPPPHIYTSENNIQAIGVDRAASIIHIPLIHPTLSPTKRPQRLVDQRKSKYPGQAQEKASVATPVRFKQLSQTSYSECGKRMPIAILSLLSPTNPFPASLAESLDNIAPLLATAFHNARQHSNLEKEVVGLARRRQVLESKSGIRDIQQLPNIAGTAGFPFAENRDQAFSPTSTSSVGSEYSSMSMHSPRGSLGGNSAAATPGWVSQETGGRYNKQLGHSPGQEMGTDSYFTQKPPSHPHELENRHPGSPKENIQEFAPTDRTQKSSHPKISIPLSTITSQASNSTALAETEQIPKEGDYAFKEPSLLMLKMMIDNGATQQFISEPVGGSIVWANSKFQAYRNTSALEINKHSWKNIHPEEQKAFRKLWQRSLLTGEMVSQRVRLKRFDGEYRWFHMKILPQKDRHGLIRHWHGQAMDTHEQHIAEIRAAREKEKAASEAKYRALANSNPHSIFAASVITGMTFANTQWLSYSGQTLEETLGFGFLDHVHPEDILRCRFPGVDESLDLAEIKSLLAPKTPLVRQESTASSGGESKSTSTADTDKTAKQYPSSSSSETSRVEAPNDLLRGLVNDGVVKCTKDGQGNITVTTEMRLKSRTGEYRWHLVQGSLIESVNFGQGEAQWFIACADITDQKHIEAQLKEANDALEKEMSRKMEYLSSMSHEIRTPLNGILGNLQFLTNSGLDEHQQDWVFGAQKAAQGMHTLINDILDVSKAEAKMLKLSRQWFNVRSITEEVMETLMSKATEKHLELCYEITDKVPSAVNGDPGRIKQILLNLVGNAIKFTRHGEIWVKCDVHADAPQDLSQELAPNETLLLFTVKDTGSGFTEDDAKLLFKPYSQIDNNDTRNIGGTGLGLILCRTMVELHGGKIWAESVPGKGSTFTFYARFFVRGDTTTESRDSESSTDIVQSIAPSPAILEKGHLLRQGVAESPIAMPRFFGSDQSSPAMQSSGSSALSGPSVGSLSIHRSMRSSASTIESVVDNSASMKLTLPTSLVASVGESSEGSTPKPSVEPETPAAKTPEIKDPPPAEAESFRPPMFSILIVCPQENTRRTTQDHVQRILPKSIPAQVTTEGNTENSLKMIGGDDPVTFTHIILQLGSATDVLTFMEQIFNSISHPHTCIVVVTDQAQQASICSGAPDFDYDQLSADNRLRFILKPAKPHKFAKIFDPKQENAQSTDDQTRAELREKQLLQRTSYAMFKEVLGNKGIRALAVEDNNLNMEILVNFLGRICCMEVTKAWDGEECLEQVFSHPPNYFSVIITDIEMPRMDGYTACRRIREWEHKHHHPHVPMVSLSANVMSKGWRESAEAGFTHYSMKPVEWRDLGNIIVELLAPSTPHTFLRDRPLPPALMKLEEEEAMELELQAQRLKEEKRRGRDKAGTPGVRAGGGTPGVKEKEKAGGATPGAKA